MPDFNTISPWKDMIRCTLSDAGTVNHYFGQTGYAEDGTDGQVMVEIPKFYYRKYSYGDKHSWSVSATPKPGYKLHPAFIGNDGLVKEKIYISAFEGVAQEIATGNYYEDAADAYPVALDDSLYILTSVAGYKPKSYQYESEFRTMCTNRGTGWYQYRYVDHALLQLLSYIEYGTFNTQAALGLGIVNKASGTYNEAEDTDSNHSTWSYSLETPSWGDTSAGLSAVIYRGIENPYGNIWKWADNVQLYGDGYYLGIGVEPSDARTDYQFIAIPPLGYDGYVYNYFSDIVHDDSIDYAFFPSELGGGDSTYFTDYHWSFNPGAYRALRAGGSWSGSRLAGFGCLRGSHSPSTRARDVGGRVIFCG